MRRLCSASWSAALAAILGLAVVAAGPRVVRAQGPSPAPAAAPAATTAYVDPDAAFSLQVPAGWQAGRQPSGAGSTVTGIGTGGADATGILIVVAPNAQNLGPETLNKVGTLLTGNILDKMKQENTLTVGTATRVKVAGQEAVRIDITATPKKPGTAVQKGYALTLLSKKNIFLIVVAGPVTDTATRKQADASLTTLKIEPEGVVATAPPDSGSPALRAEAEGVTTRISAEEKELQEIQMAFLSSSVTAPMTEADARAAFTKQDAARAAAKPATAERTLAARKAMDLAAAVAWALFDAKKYDEAADWFARRAEQKRDSEQNGRAYEETQYAGSEGMIRLKTLISHIQAPDSGLSKEKSDAVVRGLNLAVTSIQDERIKLLQSIARDGNDAAALEKYAQLELAMRRSLVDIESGVPGDTADMRKAAVASAIENLAEAQTTAALYEKAEATYNEALALRRALPADFAKRNVFLPLNALGSIFLTTGDNVQARDYFLQTVAALTEADPVLQKAAAAQPEAARAFLLAEVADQRTRALINLGVIAMQRDDFPEALSWLGQAQKVTESIAQDASIVGTTRTQLLIAIDLVRAVVLAQQGDVDVALKTLDTATTRLRSIGNDSSVFFSMVSALGVYATLWEKGGLNTEQLTAAGAIADQARHMAVAAQDMNNLVGATYIRAKVDIELSKYDTAIQFGNEALVLARKLGDAKLISESARTVAEAQVKAKRPADTLPLLAEAETADKRTGSPLDAAATFDLRGQALEAQNDREGALANYKQSITLMESVRTRAASESDFSNLKTRYEVYERLVGLLIQMNRPDEAFDYLTRSRSKKMQDSLRLTSIKTDNKALQALLDRYNALGNKLRSAEEQLQTEQAKPNVEQDATKIQNLKLVVASTRGEFSEVTLEIKKANPNFSDIVNVDPKLLRSAQKDIPAGTILVEYAPLGEQLYVFLVTKDSLKVYSPTVKPEDLWVRVREFRKLMDAAKNRVADGDSLAVSDWMGDAAPVKALRENLVALYDMLITPLAPELDKAQTIAFIPTQLLYYLPMHALAHVQDGKLRFLIQDKQVAYLAQADVLNLVRPRDVSALGIGLTACGNPAGSDLPHAQEEVASIAKVFPATQILSGAQATKSAVTEGKNLDKRILHFATHGVLNASAPTKSYIQLAHGAAGDQDNLTMGDVMGLDLDKVDLVTLSACQTALGERNPDGREVTSLATSFTTAGARAVVASLWSVSDESTNALMVAFYKELAAGKNKAAALQSAQLAVMQTPKYNHPFYWAPFDLMGDWR